MKIFESTEYIENPQVRDLKLKVNSMWDFSARSVCYKDIDKTFGVGKETIAYDIEECVEVKDSFVVGSNPPKPCKSTRWQKADITREVTNQLEEMGYVVSSSFAPIKIDTQETANLSTNIDNE